MARRDQKTNDLIYLAWHIEAFSRAKKLPKLETVLKKRRPRAQGRVLTKDQLIEIAKKKGLAGPW